MPITPYDIQNCPEKQEALSVKKRNLKVTLLCLMSREQPEELRMEMTSSHALTLQQRQRILQTAHP